MIKWFKRRFEREPKPTLEQLLAVDVEMQHSIGSDDIRKLQRSAEISKEEQNLKYRKYLAKSNVGR